jgi:hypothetical protein
MPKYPNIHVQLTGEDGNAFSILGIMNKALRDAGVSGDERQLFVNEAMEGNYDHLLQTCLSWVTVE